MVDNQASTNSVMHTASIFICLVISGIRVCKREVILIFEECMYMCICLQRCMYVHVCVCVRV